MGIFKSIMDKIFTSQLNRCCGRTGSGAGATIGCRWRQRLDTAAAGSRRGRRHDEACVV